MNVSVSWPVVSKRKKDRFVKAALGDFWPLGVEKSKHTEKL